MTSSATVSAVPPLVLLVQDDPDTAEMYETYLTATGYRVVGAQTEPDACTRFDELQPDIVVTDLGLPRRSEGLHFIDHVRGPTGGEGASVTPVILVTGADRGTISHAIVTRVTSILVKPVLPDALESEVRSRLLHHRMVRERARLVQARVPSLIAKSNRLIARSRDIIKCLEEVTAAGTARCPQCGESLAPGADPLRRDGSAGAYDYFEPCARGCGSFFRRAGGKKFYRLP